MSYGARRPRECEVDAHTGGIGLSHPAPRSPGHSGIEVGWKVLRATDFLNPDRICVVADDIVKED